MNIAMSVDTRTCFPTSSTEMPATSKCSFLCIQLSETFRTRKKNDVPVYAMKAYSRMGGIPPLFLNLSISWKSWKWVGFMTQPLHPWGKKTPWYQLNRRQDGPQRQPGGSGKEKNFLPMARIKPWTAQPIGWSLHKLRYPSMKQKYKMARNHGMHGSLTIIKFRSAET